MWGDFAQHVIGIFHQSRALAQQLMGATGPRSDGPRHGKHVAPLLGRELCRDERAAALVGLDDDRPKGQAADYPIAGGEILGVRLRPHGIFGDDGAGLGDTPLLKDKASAAKVKKLYLIDIAGAVDVTGVTGPSADLTPYAVPKKEFLNVVTKLNAAGINSLLIPSKMEGVTFGPDVVLNRVVKHTLYLASDNDFLATVADPFTKPTVPTRGSILNPNQIYVFAFGDEELPGYVPQPLQ